LIADTEKEILKLYGAWGEKKNYGKVYEGVLRTTFILDEQGIIEKIFTQVDTNAHTEQIRKGLKLNE
jgi:peroxiredoxin Q/BCP